MTYLLLFDVDGTLLRTGNASRRAFSRAFERATKKKKDFTKLDLGGRTDQEIIEDVLSKTGIPEKEHEYKTRLVLSELPDLLKEELEKEPNENKYVCPGVERFLQLIRSKIQCPDDPHNPLILYGLLTGNIRRTTEIKLRYFNLIQYFNLDIGAYGDDAKSRAKLVDIAVARAINYALKKKLVPKNKALPFDKIILFGDTPRDVACARETGVISVVFPTGRYSKEELKQANPDFLFNSFEELCRPENLEKILSKDENAEEFI